MDFLRLHPALAPGASGLAVRMGILLPVGAVPDLGQTFHPRNPQTLPPVADEFFPRHVGVGVKEVDQFLSRLPSGVSLDCCQGVIDDN